MPLNATKALESRIHGIVLGKLPISYVLKTNAPKAPFSVLKKEARLFQGVHRMLAIGLKGKNPKGEIENPTTTIVEDRGKAMLSLHMPPNSKLSDLMLDSFNYYAEKIAERRNLKVHMEYDWKKQKAHWLFEPQSNHPKSRLEP
ncbi:hypothetical protein HY989_06185 [Candidatus Micrarchaeota archaeon]|nr:hypothetical protein [Candidatus Micrarchaeota archaeon]